MTAYIQIHAGIKSDVFSRHTPQQDNHCRNIIVKKQSFVLHFYANVLCCLLCLASFNKQKFLEHFCEQVCYCFCSVTEQHPTLCNHGLQHIRLLCPPPSARACSNSCPVSRRCCLTLSSSGVPFSFCFKKFFQHQGLFQ